MKNKTSSLNSFALYRRLLTYVWPFKIGFVIAVISMITIAAATPGFTALLKPLIDGGFIERNSEVIRLLPFQLFALFAIRGVASFSADYSVGWVARRVIFSLRSTVFGHLIRLPSSYYDKSPSSIVSAKLIFDIEQIAHATTLTLFILIKDGFTVLLLLMWMFYLNWKLTMIVMVVAPFVVLLIRLMTGRLRKASKNIQTSVGMISQISQEASEGHRVVKAYNAQDSEFKNFTKANRWNMKQNMRRITTSAVGIALIQIMAGTGIALAIYIALHTGGTTAGGFASYVTSMILVMNPIKRLAKINESIQMGLAAAESVFTVLDTEAEKDTGTKELTKTEGRIEYKNVVFAYPSNPEKVLHDISFGIEPGQTLALVGASGSGKSTLANMLFRYYEPLSGVITLDGIHLQEIKLNSLRQQLALVTQDIILFNDTIKNNIVYGAEGHIDQVQLEKAIAAARVDEFVQTLADGLDTNIGEKGLRLSGGQRQRIAIARALYKNAPILVLDEATSSLDTESEHYVQEAMDALMKDRTTLVIAHRLSTIEKADKIVVLSKGRVVETGSHQELIAKNGIYANLHRFQFRNNETVVENG